MRSSSSELNVFFRGDFLDSLNQMLSQASQNRYRHTWRYLAERFLIDSKEEKGKALEADLSAVRCVCVWCWHFITFIIKVGKISLDVVSGKSRRQKKEREENFYYFISRFSVVFAVESDRRESWTISATQPPPCSLVEGQKTLISSRFYC